MDVKVINIGDKVFKLLYNQFDEDIDIDSLLKIDYSNLIGEIVTFPVIVNRFGQLLAEAESQLAEAKLNLDVLEAKTKERLRLQITNETGKNPTVEALNNAILQEKAVLTLKRRCIEVQKTRDYLNSIFWASKDKSNKLDKLSTTIQTGDVEDSIIEGKVNNVIIKRTKRVIN